VSVYLLVDARYADKVKLEGWVKTEQEALWTVGDIEYKDVIFVKDFPAGKIEIPASPKKSVPHAAIIKGK